MIASQNCYEIDVQFATGAGDAWHAGFIAGWQNGLSYEKSLLFANAVAAFQLSKGIPGSLSDIEAFMKNIPFKN